MILIHEVGGVVFTSELTSCQARYGRNVLPTNAFSMSLENGGFPRGNCMKVLKDCIRPENGALTATFEVEATQIPENRFSQVTL